MKDPEAIQPQPQVGTRELLSIEEGYPNFRLTVTERTAHTITGDIEDITSWESDAANTPSEFHHYLSFTMHSDGCSHVWVGEKIDDTKHDGYLHHGTTPKAP